MRHRRNVTSRYVISLAALAGATGIAGCIYYYSQSRDYDREPESTAIVLEPAPPDPEILALQRKLEAAGYATDEARSLAERLRNPEHRRWMLRNNPDLARALRGDAEPSPQERLAALRRREALRKRAAALVAQLGDADERELGGLAERICACGRPAMVPLKLAELSGNFELRRRAQEISRRLRWHVAAGPLRDVMPELVEVMATGEPKARAEAVNAVVERPSAANVRFLGECLADSQVYIRQRAVDGLVAVVTSAGHDREHVLRRRVRPLLESLLCDTDRQMRLLAVGALGRIEAVSVERMAELLSDESTEMRATVLRALGFSGAREAVVHIVPLLQDPQWHVRVASLKALGRIIRSRPPEYVRSAVVKRLADDESFVRATAENLLDEWESH
ncbi:MAG: HEAT repeat domain-containing protein [Phycisphaerae bacterium]|nr:HEAT repeat domain-containing protein [Phycisphaerae bacterium]